MSYDTEKVKAGRQRIDVVQIVLDGCANTFGTSPCTATGTECFNSWETCKATEAYTRQDKVITLCTPASELPAGYIPFVVASNGIQFDPGDITPEDGIGKVGSVTVKFIDAPHDDVGVDPYVETRGYSALDRGTFWPRMRARFPNYQGRKLYWYTGYLHSPFSLSNLKRRTYLIERIDGFGRKEGVTIVAKDPIKLADDQRAVWPRKTSGILAAAISDVATPATIDITTEDASQYALDVYETSSAVAMADEVFQYTGTTIITGGVRLTGVTRGAPSPYVTKQSAHEIGDDVQKCAYFDTMKAPDIIRRLLILGAEIDSAYIDYTTWEDLYDTWLAGLTLTRLITKPIGVNKLISEVLQQSSAFGIWWDDVNEAINYEVIRPAALLETVTTITDDSEIVAGSIIVSDDPDRLINDFIFRYGQIDPTQDDKASNYLNAVESIDSDSVSANEVGSSRLKEVFGTWHPAPNTGEIAEIADRYVLARATIPFKVEFMLDRKDDALQTGSFVDVSTNALRDIYGNPRTIRCRVTKVDNAGDNVKYLARQDFAPDQYAVWAPDSIADGTAWADASDQERLTYMFWSDDSGLYSDGTTGKRWY